MAETRRRKSSELTLFEQQQWQQQCKAHPTLKADYIPKPRYNDATANGLTKAIIEHIISRGGQAERKNTMGVARVRKYTDVLGHEHTSVSRTFSNETRGSADIHATIHGRSVKIEIKIGTDRQSEYQRTYQQEIERAGGLYYVAKDFAGYVAWYRKTFGE